MNVIIFLVRRRRNRYTPLSQSSIRHIEDVTIHQRIGGGQFGDVYQGIMEVGMCACDRHLFFIGKCRSGTQETKIRH